jgi:hypothetical protein
MITNLTFVRFPIHTLVHAPCQEKMGNEESADGRKIDEPVKFDRQGENAYWLTLF